MHILIYICQYKIVHKDEDKTLRLQKNIMQWCNANILTLCHKVTYFILWGYNYFEILINVLNLNLKRKVFQSTYFSFYYHICCITFGSFHQFLSMYCAYGINIALNQNRVTCIYILFYRLMSMHSAAHFKQCCIDGDVFPFIVIIWYRFCSSVIKNPL